MKKRILLSLMLFMAFGAFCIFTANADNPPFGKTTKPESETGTPPDLTNSNTTKDGKQTPDNGTNQKKCKCKEQPKTDPTTDPKVDSKCLHVTIPFGQVLNEPMLSDGEFMLYYNNATPLVFSPQGLHYSHILFTGIISEKTSDLAAGVIREVTLYTQDSIFVTYQFKSGESVGKPINENRNYVTVLKMVDASGNPVLDSPVYYDLYPGGGDVYRYSVATKKVVSMTTPAGRTILASDRGVSIEVINDEEGIMRQICSGSDGLADIVTINDYKYEIRLYSQENEGTKNSSGIYEPTGNPHTVWTIENPVSSDTEYDFVKITKSSGGVTYVWDWEYREAIKDWQVTAGNGLRTSWKERYDNSTGTTVVEIVKDGSGNIASKKITETCKFNFGEAATSETTDPDGTALKTEYTYFETNVQPAKYGKRKTLKNPDGSWESYDYDLQGRPTVTIESYLDAAFNSEASAAKARYYYYTSLDSADVLTENDSRPRTYEEKTLGNTTKKIYYVYKSVGGEAVTIEETGLATYGDSANLRTVTTSYAANTGAASAGRVKTIQHPDGKLDTYTYEYGAYSSNPNPESSSFSAGTGDALRRTIVHGMTASSAGISGKSTKEVVVTDGRGDEVMTETYAYDGSGYSRIAWNVKTYDSQHHVLASYNSNGTYSTATWSCCNKQSETLDDGTAYAYSYNLLQQMTSKAKTGGPTTAYTYDVEGRVLSETVSGGSLSLSSTSVYDGAGRVTSQTDPAGLVTTYSYENGGRSVTATLPGGFSQITEKYIDGKIKSVTGSSVVAKYYTYGANTNGTQWTKVCTTASNGPNYVKTTTDVFERTVSEERPGYTGTLTTGYFYSTQGLLTKTTSTGNADTLYAYDDFNNQLRSALDLNSNGQIDVASDDRVSETDTSFVSESSNYYVVTTNKVYNDSGSAVTTGITKKQLTGLPTGAISKTISSDINSNETVSTTTLDRSAKTIVQTVNVPDSNVDSVSTTVNGLLTSSTTSSNLTYAYSYDGLGRQTGQTDPRTGAAVTHYNALGQVDYAEDAAGKQTSFTYESATGRRASVVNALGKATAYTYNSRGQILTVRGDASYPLDYVYDSYGRMTQLKTYRDSNLTNPDITTWTYQDSTGLLTSKTYADNKSVGYSYSADGKLATRTWSRGVVTTYAYNLAGDLTGIDYSDTTPDFAFTYNRLGQQLTVTDAVGSRTFGYNSTFQLTSEAITGIYNKTLSRSYDSLGRSSGMNIGTEYDVDYGYDAVGRFSSVTNDSDVFTYGYLANSNLISGISYPNNISVTKSYESNRDLVTSIENKYGTTTISKYDYTNDNLGRRTAMGKSGTAFTQSDSIAYGYNDRSEVTSAVATNQATFNYGFNFDAVGNRITSASTETGTSVTRTYTSNQLNQYTAINNPSRNPTYNDDGSMTTDGTWTFSWDGENRLLAAEKSGQRLEFKYDYMSRRVEKRVLDGSSETSKERFVYDAFLQVEKLNALDNNAVEKKRIWGAEDKVIADINSSGTSFYALGDENKNITEYLDASGTIQGHYEFSPFGKVTVASGANPDNFDFRFSSEYFDQETGLVYYNHRYNSPELGRWLSRDPIEEEGGENLYGMVDNALVNYFDYLGEETICKKDGNFTISGKRGKNKVSIWVKGISKASKIEYYLLTLTCKCEYLCCDDTPKYWKELREEFSLSAPATYQDSRKRLEHNRVATDEAIESVEKVALDLVIKNDDSNSKYPQLKSGDLAKLVEIGHKYKRIQEEREENNRSKKNIEEDESRFIQNRINWKEYVRNKCKDSCKK